MSKKEEQRASFEGIERQRRALRWAWTKVRSGLGRISEGVMMLCIFVLSSTYGCIPASMTAEGLPCTSPLDCQQQGSEWSCAQGICTRNTRLDASLEDRGTSSPDTSKRDTSWPGEWHQGEAPSERDNTPDLRCQKDQKRPCFTFDPKKENVGKCRSGLQTCDENGIWGGCIGQLGPDLKEECDGEDDNCDGVIDEGCECRKGQTSPCGSGIGECKQGTRSCLDGKWEPCKGGQPPVPEQCNKKDDDCDGQVDEEITPTPRSCVLTAHKGECQNGHERCVNGQMICQQIKPPSIEECDGKDNNCDGQIDEALSRSCYEGPSATRNMGTCRDGVQTCVLGNWGTCLQQQKPVGEVCDGLDNNCDGQIDNSPDCKCVDQQTQPCGLERGECKKGIQTCTNGAWGVCKNEVGPKAEDCNGKDDDCDGQVDETLTGRCYPATQTGCTLLPNGTYQCKGTCQPGTQACNQGKWETCTNMLTPTTEVCDGKDNDCDGVLDNDADRPCQTLCGNGKELCKNGKLETCNATQPAVEVCDGKDNDCDGKIDEDFDVDQDGATTCGGGDPTKKDCNDNDKTVKPGNIEYCNGKDDNCDGKTDDLQPLPCYTGPAGTEGKGRCKGGQKFCQAGNWTTCQGEVRPIAELCRNNIDDNCDGKIDEICGPLYPFLHARADASRADGYLLNAALIANNGYRMRTTNNQYPCAQYPLFLTPNSSGAHPGAYSCILDNTGVNSGDYVAHFNPATANKVNPTSAKISFHAVIPLKNPGAVWAALDISKCKKTAGSRCTNVNSFGTPFVTFKQKGIYTLKHASCTATQPIFTSIFNLQPSGYIFSNATNGECTFTIFGLDRRPADLPFAFWLPNKTLANWAKFSETGAVTLSNDFGKPADFPGWRATTTPGTSTNTTTPLNYNLTPPFVGGVMLVSRSLAGIPFISALGQPSNNKRELRHFKLSDFKTYRKGFFLLQVK